MKTEKQRVHFTHQNLVGPYNPVTVNLIGAGGTGSKVLTALLEMNHSLIALGHPGLQVRLWDDDIISEANLGRQRFAACEVGLYKSVALINRINRFAGTAWKAETVKFERDNNRRLPEHTDATLYLSCVDSVAARFEIADILKAGTRRSYHQPMYWMDFGNSQKTGQVILSTVGKLLQPESKKYEPVRYLPFVTDEFRDVLKQSETADDTPSCSLAEALLKQDLYINAALAQLGCSLLWNLLSEGMTAYRGFFLNIADFRAQPLAV